MPVINCRHFTGYKPCGRSPRCDDSCAMKDIPNLRLLIIHLGALGAVLRSTSLLPAIKRKYPSSHVTWITDKPAHFLLQNHPSIDRILTTEIPSLLSLRALEFDIAFCIDKGLEAAGILESTKVDLVYGFTHDKRTGAILPATEAASYLWELGLDNHKKFFVNKKPETQLVAEALELTSAPHGFRRDEYGVHFNQIEMETLKKRSSELRKSKSNKESIVIGINTGCSHVIAAKKMTVPAQREMIRKIISTFGAEIQIVLLGGPEDTLRNQEIGEGLDVIQTSTTSGLRDGLISVAACDIVVSGDSLGMHMAIGLKKWVVAWFGPTCSHEIDLYDRGVSILTKASCSPCWKRVCHKSSMCYDQVDLNEIVDGVSKGIQWFKGIWSSKLHSGEISFSQSP